MVLALLCSVTAILHAENIGWESPADGVNQQSSELAMDAGFTFQLGVFSGGFVPSPLNLADWDAFWHVADESTYSTSAKRFAGIHTVTDNEPPFLAGTPAWIMGTKVTSTGTEKILFRRPSWTWPTPNEFNPLGPIWSVNGDANIDVVIGTVNPGGVPFLMRSEVIRDYPQWRALTLVGEPRDAPGDDPDGDGVSNLMEFVFDTDPKNPASRNTAAGSFVNISGEDYLQLAIPRKRSHLATLTVQVSSDLEAWNSGPAFTEVVSDDPLMWTVRDKTSRSASGGKRFIRLQAVLP